jgi:undecaprenyl diphosphate synthase
MLPETDRTTPVAKLKAEILASGSVPEHVAVIMDGNGRWARGRGRLRIFGHLEGRKSVRETVNGCRAIGVKVLTLYTFSVENWQRPATEVSALMRILQQTLREQREEMKENGIRLEVIGRTQDLPKSVQECLRESQEFLDECRDMTLVLALSYSGRMELARGARILAERVQRGELSPEEISEDTLGESLYTTKYPDPDLLIRTSGEMRVSNFMLWQVAYAEIYVTDILWPDFRREHLYKAILDFQQRERRFGRV